MFLEVPGHYFPVLVLSCVLAACATQPANYGSSACLQDLEAIPPFLLENDAGAKDHLAQKGQSPFDAALGIARAESKNAQDASSCSQALNKYLQTWRSSHLGVDGTESGTSDMIAMAADEETKRPQFKALSRHTALLTLPSFFNQYREDLKTLLQRHRTDLQARPYWIVDVRKNDGGSDSTYEPLLPWLVGNERVDVGAEWLVTPHNIAAQEAICAQFAPGDAECESFTKRAVEAMRGAPAGSYVADGSGDLSFEPAQPELRRPRRVAVLVDSACGSSCEEFLLTVKQSFSVKLVGRGSHGGLDYSNLRPFHLPSGKRQLWYATSRSKRLPHLPVDLTGVLPDVYLPEPADERERAEEILRVQRWLEGGSLAPLATRSLP